MSHEPEKTSIYVGVYLALMVLLAVSIVVAQVDLGTFNLVVALIISVVKTVLVAAFFMHLRHEGPVIRLAAATALLFLAILMGLTIFDIQTRA